VILFLFAYLLFYVSLLLDQNWHVALFSIFGWLSIIAIVSLVIADLILLLIKTTDEITGRWRILPYMMIPVSYILMRALFFFIIPQAGFANSVSLVVMILSVVIVVITLLKYKTNKFKTEVDMKSLKKLTEDDSDEPG
jgi:hypothetical protein